jgi:3-oxoacyl-[acyl-carrier-protein] synthase II
MKQEAIVITGLGVLACNGVGRQAYWKALQEGKSGIRLLDRFDASDLPCRIAGQLWDFNPEDFMKKSVVRTWCRHVHQAIGCSRLAVEDAELGGAKYDPERVATGIGTSIGNPIEGYRAAREAYDTGGFKMIPRLSSSKFSGHSATANVTVDLGFQGPAMTISSGCATGLDALTWGVEQIRSGRADAALVGATESPIFPMSLASGCALRILSKKNDAPETAMRPFDRNGDGIVLSEAAVAVVLEKAGHAQARGAQILGEVLGYGSAAEALSSLVLDKEGRGLARAITAALDDSGVAATDIDHVQAHGVSLAMYDRSETNSYKLALGDHAYRVPISAVKSMTGQPYAAGGLLGLGGALMALNTGIIPPTINLEDADPECDLDYVPQQERFNDVQTALTCAMSFGGTHTAVVLRRMN